MPNWCSNKLSIYGDSNTINDVVKFLKAGKGLLSSIIPMPAILEQTESGSADMGYDVLYGDCSQHLASPWVQKLGITNQEALKTYLANNRPQYLEQGEIQKKAIDETGCRTWYDWAIKNWGTKWDVEDFDLAYIDGNEYISFDFQTAWSPPIAVIAALAEKFPAVNITFEYAEEGCDFAGELQFSEGKEIYQIDGKCSSTGFGQELLASYDTVDDEEEE